MPRRTPILAGGALLLGIAFVTPLPGQMPDRIAPDPDAPVKEGFDTGRAILWARPNFVPLRDPRFQPLRTVLRNGAVEDDTPVLVWRAGGATLAMVSSQMAYHHVAQGEMAGEPWMVTF